MHRVFQRFVDRLNNNRDPDSFRQAMAEAASAFALPCFAYLRALRSGTAAAALISTYPTKWTEHYLNRHYEKIDPVIRLAHARTEPFESGFGADNFAMSPVQARLFDEASEFGIRCGFTIPIRSGSEPVAAVTFASDSRHSTFRRMIEANTRVLQLMAICLYAHATRRLYRDPAIGTARLSPRERECLRWAAAGKSCWESAHILNLSPQTMKFHLDNAKQKFGVRTICQAVVCFERTVLRDPQLGSTNNPCPTGQGL